MRWGFKQNHKTKYNELSSHAKRLQSIQSWSLRFTSWREELAPPPIFEDLVTPKSICYNQCVRTLNQPFRPTIWKEKLSFQVFRKCPHVAECGSSKLIISNCHVDLCQDATKHRWLRQVGITPTSLHSLGLEATFSSSSVFLHHRKICATEFSPRYCNQNSTIRQ